ncbi:MAG: hypothetical protein CMJ18_00990 [Phycisphaeraceae bacterium]|nr:hypothetical protein [Phycisphaeraceae bacterium]
MPSIHVPYLIGAGLYVLGQSVIIYLEPEGLAASIGHSMVAVCGFLHLGWLFTLFTDGERHLEESAPMPARRVVILAVLLCIIGPIWTAVALAVILRATVGLLKEKNLDAPPALTAFAQDAPALGVAGAILCVVHVGVIAQVDALGGFGPGAGGAVTSADVLGSSQSYLYTSFNIACGAYYLVFVARAVPALYRGYAQLQAKPNGAAVE